MTAPHHEPGHTSDPWHDHKPTITKPPEAVFLDPWLTSSGDALRALVDGITSDITPSRRDAAERREQVVGNVVANLALLALSPHAATDGRLAVSTGKTRPTRYERQDYPQRHLGAIVEELAELGLLVRHPHVFKRLVTTIEPSPDFISRLAAHGVRLRDIGREDGGERLWLVARTGEKPFGNEPPPKVLIHYDDTEETRRLRGEVERINAFLSGVRMTKAGEQQAPLALHRRFLLRTPQAPHVWELNGRLQGAWWMNTPRAERHLIKIEGEDIADLDFQAMFATLAYLRVTGRLPDGDPYDISGLERHRAGAKLAMLSMLSRSSPMQRLSPELRDALPEGWDARRLVAAMAHRHPAIASCFGSDVGVELMAAESRILISALLELERQGIPAMPLHDGLQVRQFDKSVAMRAMQAVSKQVLGTALPVVEKPIVRPAT
ncbi:hypothetical protein [Ancylobacter amanitiformis]|uniref:Helicase XPB/Ssl2 N-terminal domain-containing protein n=1 Tax=Ancylobacter amanitiformis TaxID=217069 RepID=A0ABU0LSL4_9HYPH|nr:hypothetical protein [Ancylobacter amanitiformis]MDQ0511664.1 hypothetical protein [Ancylobacter amanitiformis]